MSISVSSLDLFWGIHAICPTLMSYPRDNLLPRTSSKKKTSLGNSIKRSHLIVIGGVQDSSWSYFHLEELSVTSMNLVCGFLHIETDRVSFRSFQNTGLFFLRFPTEVCIPRYSFTAIPYGTLVQIWKRYSLLAHAEPCLGGQLRE